MSRVGSATWRETWLDGRFAEVRVNDAQSRHIRLSILRQVIVVNSNVWLRRRKWGRRRQRLGPPNIVDIGMLRARSVVGRGIVGCFLLPNVGTSARHDRQED